MKQYDNVQQLAQAAVDALKQYQNLMSGSAVILFLAAQQNSADNLLLSKRSIAKDSLLGEKMMENWSETATQIPLKETAESIYQKVQEYRQTSPQFVVEMLDEGLEFLEKLCEKYM